MPTIASVASAIDTYSIATITTVPVIFGNIENEELSEGSLPYLAQRTIFSTESQLQLGDTNSSRKRGSVIFIIHVRRNTGDGSRNQLLDLVLKSFRSKRIGGATFMNGRIISSARTENWALTGVEIPFYFDEM